MTENDLSELLAAAEEASDRFDLLDRLRDHPGLATATPEDSVRAAALLAVSGDPADLPVVAELAGRAHQAGAAGAGIIYAEAVDKISLYQGQPQRYGTVMVEHQGDIVQPPVDPSVSDDERAALGVPSMAELRRRMEEVGQQMAAERARSPASCRRGSGSAGSGPTTTPSSFGPGWRSTVPHGPTAT